MCVCIYIYVHEYIYPQCISYLSVYGAYPKAQWLKAKGVHYHRVSSGQASWRGLGRCFWIRSLMRLQSSCLGLQVPEGSNRTREFFPTRSCGCGQTTVPSHMGCLPGGCVPHHGNWWSKRKERDQMKPSSFYNLVMEMTSHFHFCLALCTR